MQHAMVRSLLFLEDKREDFPDVSILDAGQRVSSVGRDHCRLWSTGRVLQAGWNHCSLCLRLHLSTLCRSLVRPAGTVRRRSRSVLLRPAADAGWPGTHSPGRILRRARPDTRTRPGPQPQRNAPGRHRGTINAAAGVGEPDFTCFSGHFREDAGVVACLGVRAAADLAAWGGIAKRRCERKRRIGPEKNPARLESPAGLGTFGSRRKGHAASA